MKTFKSCKNENKKLFSSSKVVKKICKTFCVSLIYSQCLNLPMGRMNFIKHSFLISAFMFCYFSPFFCPQVLDTISIVLRIMPEFKFMFCYSREIYSRRGKSLCVAFRSLSLYLLLQLSIISFCTMFFHSAGCVSRRLRETGRRGESNLVCCYFFDDGNKDSRKNNS